MKNNNLTPKKIFSDPQYENIVKTDLEKARQALQRCLDVWTNLELTPCTDIFALISNPQKVYGEAVNQLAEPPETFGRFKISKEAYINILEIPIPNDLYLSAKNARTHPYSGLPELWNIKGNQVVLNQTEAETLIDAHTIYASGDKAKFIEDLDNLVESLNSLNSRLINMAGVELFNTSNPITRSFFQNWCTFEGGDNRGTNMQLKLSNEFLRNLTFIK